MDVAGNGQPMGANGRPLDTGYGRFLDTRKVSDAIASLTDSATAASLTELLTDYEEALTTKDDSVTQTALEALLDAMAEADLKMEQKQTQAQTETRRSFSPEDGRYLDTGKVTAAIATVEDTGTAASLSELLSTYETALSGTDADATQAAFKALLDAMAEAGLKVELSAVK